MKPEDHKLEDLKIGDRASFEVSIDEKSQNVFAEMSGDYNPIHKDVDYAKSTSMGKPVVYGMYLGSLVSRLVGMNLPGKRSLIVDIHLSFPRPVYEGDTLVISGEIAHVSKTTRLVTVNIKISRMEEVCVLGQVNVMVLE